MSIFPLSTDLGPDEMTKNFVAVADWMSADRNNLVPYIAQSTGAAVVAGSFGLGMASQMTGTMLGMFEGMMSVSMKTAQGPSGTRVKRHLRTKAEPAGEVVQTAETASNIVSLKNAKKAIRAKSTVAKTKKATAKIQVPAVEKAATSSPPKASVVEADAELSKLIAALEPEDFHRPSEVEKPILADDLKRISGIGPKLEKVLNSLGIWTFDQMSKWSPNEIAWVDDYLQFKGRIERDNWMAQAAALVAGGRDEDLRVSGKEPR